jgi:hypothetical protein
MYEDDEHGGAREGDPETSWAAAFSLDPTQLYAIIVKILIRIGPATTHEIADASGGIGWGSITPRMRKMVEKGLVYDTGERRADRGGKDRKPTKRLSIVWALSRPAEPAGVPLSENRGPLPEMSQVDLLIYPRS